ncbi:MAG: MFS transporter [Vulcanimicrobiaceae bacterium]
MSEVESPYAWFRLGIAVLLSTIGGVGMWSVVVALPAVQADFGVTRAEAALPYTLAMIGFAISGIFIGRLVDRIGIVWPVAGATIVLGLGYIAASRAPNLWLFALAHGALIGVGSAATFAPLMADISHWFTRRRGIALAVCACGNYLAGASWPPVVQHFISTVGWRATHFGIGVFCIVAMLPLVLAMRRTAPAHAESAVCNMGQSSEARLRLSPNALQGALAVAGVACCVAMSMPQVHIVAYCGDLGYGVTRGAQMLSLMLGFGLISRVASGFVADRLGGLATLLIGSALQAVALLLYLGFDSLTSLYAISALFGLFQGGIVPCYAIIVREYLPANEAGMRVGVAMTATLTGMALGGWLSGAIFDLTGSYHAAFVNGVLWNLLNGSIVLWLLLRLRQRRLATVALS